MMEITQIVNSLLNYITSMISDVQETLINMHPRIKPVFSTVTVWSSSYCLFARWR